MSRDRKMTDEVETAPTSPSTGAPTAAPTGTPRGAPAIPPAFPDALAEARGAAATGLADDEHHPPPSPPPPQPAPAPASEPLAVAKVGRLEDLALMKPAGEMNETEVLNELALIGEPVDEVRAFDRTTHELNEKKRSADEAHEAMIAERGSVKRRMELRASALGARVASLTTRINRIQRDKQRAAEEAEKQKQAEKAGRAGDSGKK